MGKGFMPPPPPVVKACMQLVDAFADSYKPVVHEEEADELFSVGRIREYFNAWPQPKSPDPLNPYLDELEKRGFAMQTGYDGQPAIFVVRWKTNGEMCGVVEEVGHREDTVRTGAQQVGALLGARKLLYPRQEQNASSGSSPFPATEEDSDDDDDEGIGGDPFKDQYGNVDDIDRDRLPY